METVTLDVAVKRLNELRAEGYNVIITGPTGYRVLQVLDYGKWRPMLRIRKNK